MSAFLSCDFFTFTVPVDLTDEELEHLCQKLFRQSFSKFDVARTGRTYGYKVRHTLDELVNIYRVGAMNNAGTTCFSIPGIGLNTFGLNITDLGKFALERGGNITRIDIAADDVDDTLDFEVLKDICSRENFKARVSTRLSRNHKNAMNNVPDLKIQPIERIRLGSKESETKVVIYNKQQTEQVDFPWRRVELRLGNREDCKNIVQALIDGEDEGPLFASLLLGKLNFLEPGYRPKQRRKTVKWWSDFLHGVSARRLKRADRPAKPPVLISHAEKQIIRSARRLVARGDVAGLSAAIADAIQAMPLEHREAILQQLHMAQAA